MMENEAILRIIEGAGYTARSYSGRGMYGRSCLGVVASNVLEMFADMLNEVDTSAEEDEISLVGDMMRNAVTDSMGRDTIVYWPNIEPPSEDSDDEE